MRRAAALLLCALMMVAPGCSMLQPMGDMAAAHERIAETDEDLAENAQERTALEAENERLLAALESAPSPEAVAELREQREALERALEQLSAEREQLLSERGRAEGRAAVLEEYFEEQGGLVTAAAGAAGGPPAAGLAQGIVSLLGLGSIVVGRARALRT